MLRLRLSSRDLVGAPRYRRFRWGDRGRCRCGSGYGDSRFIRFDLARRMPIDHFQQLTRCAMGFQRVSHGLVWVDAISIPAAMLRDTDKATILQVTNDFLHRSFCDSNDLRNVPQPGIGISGEDHEDVTVVAEQRPFAHGVCFTVQAGPCYR